MLAMGDMANVNTAELRDRCKVCMLQEVGKHCTLVIRIDFAAASEYNNCSGLWCSGGTQPAACLVARQNL
jgi:hypothetical protein